MKTPGATGCGMAHQHAKGYLALPDAAKIVAYCDIVPENAAAYRDEYGDGAEPIYADFEQMLARENLDMVSISTWPHLHAPMVIACAEARVKAIHCEKPMAPTWGEAKRMAAACEASGTQLTFDHQRRFGQPFRKAKEILKSGEIGELVRVEASCGNLFDWGTHWFDMSFYYNDDTPAEWVLGQMEPRGAKLLFGAPLETQGISHWKFTNGVHGLLVTGFEAGWNVQNRLVGTDGVIELDPKGGPTLRVMGKSQAGWREVPVTESLHGPGFIERAIADALDALKTGREPELSARRALQSSEVMFATYESSRRQGRVTLPLDIEDSPLQAWLDAHGVNLGARSAPS